MMSRYDAERFYDGRIPPGAVDDALPSRFKPASPAVRVGRVVEKPASVRARMAQVMARLALTGQILRDDLKRVGRFTDQQIDAHGNDAIREMLWENPTLLTVEFAA